MRTQPHGSWGLFARLLELARPYWLHLSGIFLLGLSAPALSLLTPIPLALVVDCVLANRPVPKLLRIVLPAAWISTQHALLIAAAVLLVGITLLTYTQSLCIWLLQTYTGERLIVEFRARLFQHAQRLSLAYHDRKGVTDSVYRIQYDAMAIQGVAINGAVPLCTSFVTLAGMVVVTSWLDWSLALVALLICPLLWMITHVFGGRLRDLWDSVKDLDSHAMGVVQEVLGAVRVVKAFGQEGREHRRFVQQSETRLHGQLALARTEATMDLLVGGVMGLGTAAVLLVGATHVRSGRLTLGQLILVMAYIAQLYEPLRTISQRLADLQAGLAGA
jgi:ATP-binding cassette subfamily B protein